MRRAGMTLVELLLVIAIMLMLMFVVLSAAPAMRQHELREAAREVNSFFAAAQARAIAAGRPVGVWIERQEGRPAAALDLYLAEEPPPFSGLSVMDRARITGPGVAAIQGLLPDIQGGELIRFNYQGPYYTITAAAGESVTFRHDSGAPLPLPTPPGDLGVPFQIFRKPRRSSATPLQMPASTVIDLAQSGIGVQPQTQFGSVGTGPVVVMFSPEGKLSRVYAPGIPAVNGRPPMAAIYLLVGRIDQVNPTAGKLNNLADPGSRWVTIGRQTGSVQTAENNASSNIATARRWARTRIGMGGTQQ